MSRRAGILGLGRNRSHAERPAAEVAAGNGKFATTNSIEDKPTSPGDSPNEIDVDKRVLPFPAVPGLYSGENSRTLTAWQFINDAVRHPVAPSDDFIVPRAVRLLRHG